MKTLSVAFSILIVVTQAQAERVASTSDSGFMFSAAPPAAEAPVIPTGRRRGVGEPKITPDPKIEPKPAPAPAPRTDANGLLPGMIDPDAKPTNGSQKAPIWKPFIRRFNKCAPGCQPIQYNSWRHGDPRCHGQGRAIDVFGMTCLENGKKKTYMAIQSGRTSGRMAELGDCLTGNQKWQPYRYPSKKVPGSLGCIWHNGSGITSGHRDHLHVSIGCNGTGL